jgi:phage tail sheath protein FI
MQVEAEFPGVVNNEESTVPARIEHAATSITGFVGSFATGPVEIPTPVRSVAQFDQLFGAPGVFTETAIAVHDFFAAGGTDAVVVRANPTTGAPTLDQLVAAIETLAAPSGELAPVQLLCLPEIARRVEPLARHEFDRLLHIATTFCIENRIFLLIDPNTDGNEIDDIERWLDAHASWGSLNSALYFPRLITPAGERAGHGPVSASGAVAGVMARTDARRGVWKAPAGLEANVGAVVAGTVSATQQSLLNRHGVNVICPLGNTDAVIWGSRTGAGSVGNEFRDVPVRRMALFIENSLLAGLRWAVMENNDEPLWLKIRQSVSSFFHDLWRTGAFAGADPEQGFFVRCDDTTMSRVTLRRGHTIVQIGFAPRTPGEFVVLSVTLVGASSGSDA